MNEHLIVILGPTASGKTSLAVKIAAEMDGEIISADSRQLYRRMDIGTGKDLDEYKLDGREIPHHLIDVADAGEKLTINDYALLFADCLEAITNRHKQPILCGGSGLYIETALHGNELSAIPVNQELRAELYEMPKASIRALYDDLDDKVKKKTDDSTLKRMI
ncbi:MAG: tRNA (adenosine(37)-N6)-dimethylallyltransferase MiaA, partial [Flavobacteriales bacterium]|nr:tRNA (adenosine(37)-N6)-dimethylallyltransferase MiaA [Flavobacteriales bacterium]